MTGNEAIILLLKCHPLVEKLNTAGLYTELSNEDEKALKGFCRVWAFGWLAESEIHEVARLSLRDINLLTGRMMREVTRPRQLTR